MVGAAAAAGGAMLLGADRLIPALSANASPAEGGISNIYCVEGFPGPVDGRHSGLDSLLALMGSKGLKLLRSNDIGPINGPDGLIAADDVVLVKINCQWEERGGTNTDLVRSLIRTIAEHPDGFTGEIVVVDNGQGRGSFTWANANAEDTTQCIQDVVDSFGTARISTFLWDNIRATPTLDYDEGVMGDGYILEDTPEPSTGMRYSYPKFRTPSGTYISLKKGIWHPDSSSYSSEKLKLINFPVLKSHGGAAVTACIKHYMGVVSQSMIDNHQFIWNGGLAAEMAHVRFPTLNILDAVYVNPHPMESGNAGPWTPYSRAVKTNRILAGLDPVAIDYWASKNILVPAAESIGYSSYASLDPDTPGGVFHGYLANSMNVLTAAGIQATMNPERITVYLGLPVTFYNDPTSGTITADSLGKANGETGIYDSGARVHVLASPPAGYSFSNWEANGVSIDDSFSSDTYMTVSSAGWLKARFQGGLAEVANFTKSPSGDVLMIVGDLAVNPHGTKPSGVDYQEGRDMTPLGFIAGMLGNSQSAVFDTNTSWVDAAGRPFETTSPGLIFVIGGPKKNAVTHYYEAANSISDRSLIAFDISGSDFVWKNRSGTEVYRVPQSSTALPPGTSDVFVMQLLRDKAGRRVVLLYGTHYVGTWAAAWYFKFVVYPNIEDYANGYYIVRWTDAASGPGSDYTPDLGDTYTILAQGSGS